MPKLLLDAVDVNNMTEDQELANACEFIKGD